MAAIRQILGEGLPVSRGAVGDQELAAPKAATGPVSVSVILCHGPRAH